MLPHLLSLEPRVLLSFDPSAREQESLELLNRMRMNPQAELSLLINSDDKDVNDAIKSFGVNKSVLARQWASLTSVPPLAWNEILYGTARAHSQAMLAADDQQHVLPGEADLGTRISDAGYDFSFVGENIFAFAKRPFHAHAGFAIDWGNAPDGIQDPPGHRQNMMSDDFREVGIGILDSTPGENVGPQLVTQDFGARFGFGNSFLLGVVYDDTNGNGFYNAGEGIAGADVHITGTGGTFDATSMSAGGYQMQLPAGATTVGDVDATGALAPSSRPRRIWLATSRSAARSKRSRWPTSAAGARSQFPAPARRCPRRSRPSAIFRSPPSRRSNR